MPPMLRRADHAAGSNARWFNSNTLADRDGYPTRNCAGHRDKGSDDGDEPEPARALPTDGVPDALLDECRVGPSVAHEGERAAALYVHRDAIEVTAGWPRRAGYARENAEPGRSRPAS